MHPFIPKERLLIICKAEIDGEIKENKPLYFPELNWLQDLRMSVISPQQDLKVLHNSIQMGVHMIAVSCVEGRDDIMYVRKVLGARGQNIKILAKI